MELDLLLSEIEIMVIPVTIKQAEFARKAF